MRIVIWALVAISLAGCASEEAAVSDVLDSDGDGFPDALEVQLASDPHNATSVPDVMVHDAISWAGTFSVQAGTDVPAPAGGGCGAQGTVDTVRETWTIEAPANATDAHVVDLVFEMHLTPTIPDADIDVYGPTGDLIAQSTAFNAQTGNTETLPVDGKHGVGDYEIVVRGCYGSGDVHVDGTATLGYTPDLETLMQMEGVGHDP